MNRRDFTHANKVLPVNEWMKPADLWKADPDILSVHLPTSSAGTTATIFY